MQFFVFSVDYSRTEHTQFEDDEYYYYVKAVPKMNVAAPEMNVKRINAQRRKKGKGNKRLNLILFMGQQKSLLIFHKINIFM